VSPDEVSVAGSTGEADAGNAISGILSERLGKGARFSIDVEYVEALDPVASLPTPAECEARIAAVQADRKIAFEPGSANIDLGGSDIMDDIAEILRECGEITLEIGGHTDSQGREVMNQQLSLSRAETVLNELRMRRVLTGSITAVGYGESRPIADNDTEEGREANRRIEFRVIVPEEVVGDAARGQDELATGAETSEERADADAGGAGAGEPAQTGATPDSETQEDRADEQD
ncbi:MAG: OmpA family protein, partial [Roseovarius sp.]|nr:OmpA family protein [Roseovarius sp.]